MAIIETDSRTAEADRVYQEFVRRGADPHAVKALLPNLVSSRPAAAQRAADWLAQNAILGNDLSDEGVRQARQVVNAAKAFHRDSLERGDFAGDPAFRPGSRYGASEADLEAELEAQSPTRAYPGSTQNRATLALNDLEADAQARHRRHDLTLHEDGRLTDPLGNVVEHIDVPTFGPASLSMRDTSPRRGGNGDGTTYYKDSADEDTEDYWARNGGAPFGG